MRANPYAVLVVGTRVRLPTKEVVPMRQLNRVPRDRRSLAALSMMLAGAFVFVGILAASVVGADKAIYWAGNLIPVVVMLVVVVGTGRPCGAGGCEGPRQQGPITLDYLQKTPSRRGLL